MRSAVTEDPGRVRRQPEQPDGTFVPPEEASTASLPPEVEVPTRPTTSTCRRNEVRQRRVARAFYPVATRTFSKVYGLAGLRVGYARAAGRRRSHEPRAPPFNVTDRCRRDGGAGRWSLRRSHEPNWTGMRHSERVRAARRRVLSCRPATREREVGTAPVFRRPGARRDRAPIAGTAAAAPARDGGTESENERFRCLAQSFGMISRRAMSRAL
jgi:hypothetical protein